MNRDWVHDGTQLSFDAEEHVEALSAKAVDGSVVLDRRGG
jgi:hypothetical protein